MALNAVERLAESGRTSLPAESMLNAMPDPVIAVGGNNDLIFANHAAEQFFRSGSSALMQTNLRNLFPSDSPILSMVDKARRGGISMTEHRMRVSMPRAGVRTLGVDVAPVGDGGDVIVVFRRESMAGRIDQTLTRQGAARSITALSSMLAHEVKNPLSGIRGAAQLLESTASDEDRQLLRLIVEETDRIVALVNRFDVFDDVPAIKRETVNIHAVLDRVARIAGAGFARGVTMKFDYDPSLPSVSGNRDQLVQIFLNLVKNAAEAVDGQDGTIRISTAYRPDVRLSAPGSESRVFLPMLVRIEDNGTGIPDDILPCLFDPFVTTKPGGSGLGLALVAKLVADHGGIVDVDSQPRKTGFDVYLPIVKQESEIALSIHGTGE